MAAYPTELPKNVRVLPEAVEQSQLNERGLFVIEGLDVSLAEQLVEVSRQPHVVEYCPNDSIKRFGSVDQVVNWQAKGRLALPLVKKAGDGALQLAGFGWMGAGEPGDDEPTIPGAKTTFAIRLYENAVGQGNALPYTRAILQANSILFGNSGVWLEAWGDNAAALRSYEQVGFERAAETPGERHGKPVARVYMTLGTRAVS